MSELMFDVGLAAKLKQAAERNNIPDLADIDWLCQGKNIAIIRRLRLGQVKLVVPKYLIDLDADPFVPKGWKVEEHRKGGQFKWDASKISFYLSKKQQGGVIEGNKLRKELADKPVYNANLLDYLLAHPHLIPEEWKEKYVFFWGTVYHISEDYLCVRYLCWFDSKWYWFNYWLQYGWRGNDPAAVPAS